jgi:hypothetical protein
LLEESFFLTHPLALTPAAIRITPIKRELVAKPKFQRTPKNRPGVKAERPVIQEIAKGIQRASWFQVSNLRKNRK